MSNENGFPSIVAPADETTGAGAPSAQGLVVTDPQVLAPIEQQVRVEIRQLIGEFERVANTPVPDDVTDCLRMISVEHLAGIAHGALRFWNVGRVLATLIDRGEQANPLLDAAATMINRSRRTVQYAVDVFRKFPDAKNLLNVSEFGVEWSDFKELARLPSAQSRDLLCRQLTSGEIDREVLRERTQQILAKERQRKQQNKSEDQPSPVARLLAVQRALKKALRVLRKPLEDGQSVCSDLSDETLVSSETYEASWQPLTDTLSYASELRNVVELFMESAEALEKPDSLETSDQE